MKVHHIFETTYTANQRAEAVEKVYGAEDIHELSEWVIDMVEEAGVTKEDVKDEKKFKNFVLDIILRFIKTEAADIDVYGHYAADTITALKRMDYTWPELDVIMKSLHSDGWRNWEPE